MHHIQLPYVLSILMSQVFILFLRILSSSGTKQLLSKTLSADFAATAQSAELQNGTILVSPHDVPSGESIIGIGVSTTHDNNTLQSAR